MYKKGSPVKLIIRRYIQELSKLDIEVKQVILYGSHARGNFRRDSDIDLVVVSEDFKGKNLRERLEILGIAAVRIMKPIEAYGVTSREIKSTPAAGFLREAIRSGVRL